MVIVLNKLIGPISSPFTFGQKQFVNFNAINHATIRQNSSRFTNWIDWNTIIFEKAYKLPLLCVLYYQTQIDILHSI